ncbi:MAG: 50S ribosomal protein L25/general stress protein Ctc [Gammaproteobacteria bacterium]|nr:50S ribosomal protein L25/general stress protein Ctc [Gammaproteobacteria bacterium]
MAKFELNAEQRDAKGTGASRRLRRAGKIPAVLYGAGKDAVMLSLEHEPVYLNVRNEAFFTSILTVNYGQQKEQAVLRDLQMHPYKPRIQHLDLQRISATEKLHMRVPLHFTGQDQAPGVKLQGGIVMHHLTEVDVTCLPHQLPEFLAVDISKLNLNESVHLSNIPLPEGVVITSIAHGGGDLAIATIAIVRAAIEEEEAAAAAAAEAAAAAAAAPAAEGAAGEAGKEGAKKEAGKEPAKKEAGKEPAKKEGGKK